MEGQQPHRHTLYVSYTKSTAMYIYIEAKGRAGVRRALEARACVRACVRECMRACGRAGGCTWVHACVRARVRGGVEAWMGL